MTVNDYNQCVRQLSDVLFRFAWKSTGNKEDGRDVVQSSFAALWEQRSKVPVAKAKAFLFQVAYNQSVDLFRRGRRMQFPAQAPEVAAWPDSPAAMQPSTSWCYGTSWARPVPAMAIRSSTG